MIEYNVASKAESANEIKMHHRDNLSETENKANITLSDKTKVVTAITNEKALMIMLLINLTKKQVAFPAPKVW